MSTFLMLLTSSPSCFVLMLRTFSLLTRFHSAAMHAKLFVIVCLSDLTSASVESLCIVLLLVESYEFRIKVVVYWVSVLAARRPIKASFALATRSSILSSEDAYMSSVLRQYLLMPTSRLMMHDSNTCSSRVCSLFRLCVSTPYSKTGRTYVL